MARASNDKNALKRIAAILLVDDHPLVRERLAQIINAEPDLRVCGEAADRGGALAAIEANRPDLVIIDLTLHQSHGLDLIKDVRVLHPRLAMLVLSMHDESLYAERALRAGARGYITKQEATKNILVAIRQILRGDVYLSEAESARIAARMVTERPPASVSMDKLTDRELRVFELIGRGYSLRQIAAVLHLDAKTIETYRTRIRTKLELRDANEVLQQAILWNRTADRS
jgi:DNA-binding NarL/FixJ family response regulator